MVFCSYREPTPTLDRNAAAMRLQKLYRKRQEEREREEEELLKLPCPAVKNVFRGHRNARTMVRGNRMQWPWCTIVFIFLIFRFFLNLWILDEAGLWWFVAMALLNNNLIC